VEFVGKRFARGPARRHITMMAPSYESLRAELDDIVERYRAHVAHDRNKDALTREEAVERIRRLGFTRGDAIRWLDQTRRRR
jgi:hypothetical protein